MDGAEGKPLCLCTSVLTILLPWQISVSFPTHDSIRRNNISCGGRKFWELMVELVLTGDQKD